MDVIGRRFTRSVEHFPIEVGGMVSDQLIDLGEPAHPIIFTPLRQFYQSAVQVQIRTRTLPEQALLSARTTIREIDPALPILGATTMAEDMNEALWAPRMGASLLGIFGLLALPLALIGIYGVMAYSVRQRHAEIGLRLALGATRRDVIALLLRQGMRLVALGVCSGVLVGMVATRLLRTMLWAVSPATPSPSWRWPPF